MSESEHDYYDEETGEWVVSCPSCGSGVRTESQTEAVKYALYAGKTCEECEDGDD